MRPCTTCNHAKNWHSGEGWKCQALDCRCESYIAPKLTVKAAMEQIRDLDITVSRTVFGEFLVDRTYYTNDPQDAVNTARDIAGRRRL